MNIKKVVLFILIILFLISLLFFICNKKSAFYDDDSSGMFNSETGQIGYMKDITPETVKDGSPFPESGSEERGSDINQNRIYSPGGSNTLSKNEPVISPLYKDDKKDINIADKRNEVSQKAEIPEKDRKISMNKITEKAEADTKKDLQRENKGKIKAAEKTDKKRIIRSAAVKDDEKIVIAKKTAPDKAVTRENISPDSKAEKFDNKGKVQEDLDKVISKGNIPLQGEEASITSKAEIVKQENNKITGTIEKKYNRLDRVDLYSGKVLTGTVVERGDVYTIITTEGKEKISKKDIQGNEIIR